MKKTVASILAILALVSVTLVLVQAQTSEYLYVGSKKSDTYHYPDCRYAKDILPDNLLTFLSAQDAVNRGYEACSVCNPPSPQPYQQIAVFSGSGDYTTEYFSSVSGEMWLSWNLTGVDEHSSFYGYMYKKGSEGSVADFEAADNQTSGSTYIHAMPGEHYLKILTTESLTYYVIVSEQPISQTPTPTLTQSPYIPLASTQMTPTPSVPEFPLAALIALFAGTLSLMLVFYSIKRRMQTPSF